MFKHSDHKILHRADHDGSLMIEHIEKWELPFYKVSHSCHKDLFIYDKDLSFFSFLSLSTVFYFIEEDIWIENKFLYPGKGLLLGLYVEAFTVFILMAFVICFLCSTKINIQLYEWQ